MAPATCTICDTPLPPFHSAGPPLCSALSCAWKYRSIPKEQLCEICGRQLSRTDRVSRACRERGCWITLNERRLRGRMAQQEAEAEDLRHSARQQFPQLRDRSLPLTIIPAYSGATTRMQKRRRESLRRRLKWILQEADEKPLSANHAPVHIPVVLEPVVQAACTTCRGNCCRNGNDHAYLTSDTMHRMQADNPELSGDQIVDAYLSHVSDRSYRNSCIFHTTTGCGLPRAMRSDTCNNFFCDPMRGFLTVAIHEPAAPAALVSIEDRTVRAGVLFDGEQVEMVRPVRTGE